MVLSSKKLAKSLKSNLLEDYYKNAYAKLFYSKSILSFGIGYSHKQLEKIFKNKMPHYVLEIGGGSGEHLPYVRHVPIEKYISLDLKAPKNNFYRRFISNEFAKKLEFVKGDAEDLKYDKFTFDRIVVPCVLAHVDDVIAVLFEIKRVAKKNSEIGILLPTDPGILNRLIKYLFTYRRLKHLTTYSPKLINAFEHKNHVSGLMAQISYVFSSDDLKFIYKPFSLIKSWNFNLLIVAKIKIN
jgi:ubiquinone/menaquinone biosynthesis C-methylase UbiE